MRTVFPARSPACVASLALILSSSCDAVDRDFSSAPSESDAGSSPCEAGASCREDEGNGPGGDTDAAPPQDDDTTTDGLIDAGGDSADDDTSGDDDTREGDEASGDDAGDDDDTGGSDDDVADDDVADDDDESDDDGPSLLDASAPAGDCTEGEVRSCAAGGFAGPCANGFQECRADGTFGDCSIAPASADSCDPGNDDNCNGVENDGCPCNEGQVRSCAAGGFSGPCASGFQSCEADGTWGGCSIAPAEFDDCALGDDANCDGAENSPLDPGCDCVEGATQSCLEGGFQGACATGTQTCGSDGQFGECSIAPLPADSCTPGNDGDCDGVENEGCGSGCTLGDRACNGNVPQECDENGEWVSEAACPSSTPCQGEGSCEACPSGTYASSGMCVAFSECVAGQYVSVAGTSTSNRQCSSCASGSFSTTPNATSCALWTSCPPGYYVSSAGAADRDRQCTPCAYGYYNGSINASSCTAWSMCSGGEVQISAGTPATDRVCGVVPSCDGLASTCGPAQNESCCTSLLVPGGSYELAEGVSGSVSDFYLDKFEVTVGRFRKFRDAWEAGYRPNTGAGKHTHLNSGQGLADSVDPATHEPGWSASMATYIDLQDGTLRCNQDTATWTATASTNERRPMNCVTFEVAYAFCIWDGGFLPSENEWTYAAVGGSQQRYYPWSNPPTSTLFDGTLGSFWVDDTKQCHGDNVDGCTLDDLIWVGLKGGGNGRYGHADLAGNVWEWARDTWESTLRDCDDCANLFASSTLYVVKGGGYSSNAEAVRPLNRLGLGSLNQFPDLGFRCARSP